MISVSARLYPCSVKFITFCFMIHQQCKTCPWKKGAKCANIPNYDLNLHQDLSKSIADEDGNLSKLNQPITGMACHYSGQNQIPCAGWLHNQIGDGNNIPLRIWFSNNYPNGSIEVDGEQKQNFQETFE